MVLVVLHITIESNKHFMRDAQYFKLCVGIGTFKSVPIGLAILPKL